MFRIKQIISKHQLYCKPKIHHFYLSGKTKLRCKETKYFLTINQKYSTFPTDFSLAPFFTPFWISIIQSSQCLINIVTSHFDNILLIFGGLSFEWCNNHNILFYNHKKRFKDQFFQQSWNRSKTGLNSESKFCSMT